MDNVKTGFAVLGVLVALFLILVVSPLAAIWAVNTLFGTGIPFTFSTWLASAVLVVVIRFCQDKKADR